jgi:hypothetical protein
MKKLILFFLLFVFAPQIKAQIVMESSHPLNYNSQSGQPCFQLSYYSFLGYKYSYWDPSLSQITIYNMNHSVDRSFAVPQLPNAIPLYLTTKLFDTDSTDFEYLLIYSAGSSSSVAVYDEAGTLLFQRDSFYISPSYQLNTPPNHTQYTGVITGTTNGSKMILAHTMLSKVEVYSLPGVFPCEPCGNPAGPTPPLSVADSVNHSNQLSPFPNPASTSVTIPYQLPAGENSGEIIFYDTMGQEVKRFKVDNQFKDIIISTQDMAAGTYYYQLQTKAGNQGTKTLVVIPQ